MTRIYALRRIGTAKMRYVEATSPLEAEMKAQIEENNETGMSGEWQVFKTSFTLSHWKKESDVYMGIYKTTAKKMFEEERFI